MCDLTAAFVGLSLAGSAIQAGGQLAQGNQAEVMGQLQRQVYEQQARSVENASVFEQGQERRKQELAAAQARAQTGASGVALEGSPSEVLMANAGQGELDIQAIQYGSQVKAGQLRTQGALAEFGGQQSRYASRIAAAGTAISGLGRAMSPFTRSVQFGQSAFA